jgi:hypothetical protein
VAVQKKNKLAAFQDVGHGFGQGSEIFDVFSRNDKKTKHASELGNASRRHKGAEGVQVLVSEASAMLVDGKTKKLGLRMPNTSFVGVQSNANTGTNTQEFLPAVAEIMLIVRVSEPIVDVVRSLGKVSGSFTVRSLCFRAGILLAKWKHCRLH